MIESLAQFFELVDGQIDCRKIQSDTQLVKPGITQPEQRTDDAFPHKASFSPQENLPDDVLMHIFTLIARQHGPVLLPIDKDEIPPQLMISHVCSRWRVLALHTFELWDQIYLSDPDATQFPYEWFLRAGISKVVLMIAPILSVVDNDTLQVVSHVGSKELRIHVALRHIGEIPNNWLPDIGELRLVVYPADNPFNITHIFPRLRAITIDSYNYNPSIGRLPLPWNQLRVLKFHRKMNVNPVMDILRQVPMLQLVSLRFLLNDSHSVDSLTMLTMHHLRVINLKFLAATGDEVVDGEDVDKILRCFICPALTVCRLYCQKWTSETYEIIKRQYNIQGLQNILFHASFPLPVSSTILKDAPMLHTLSLTYAIADGEFFAGISNSTLGRCLREFTTCVRGIVDEILEMVETRKKVADELVESGCTWREVITILKYVKLPGKRRPRYAEKLDALKEAGITIMLD